MKVNPTITQLIDKAVLAAREEREPSGRLSAGKLGYPLQWQMLHYFKVQGAPIDEYTLRKFQRGKDVEDRIVEWVQPEEKQKLLWYRDIIGFADMVIGGVPYEVKSVTNMAFKYKQKEGVSLSHKLQAMHYAKALGVDTFYVVYVASDDYRTLCFEEKVTDEVDAVIDRYEAQVKLGTIPAFEAIEKWQSNPEYNSYAEWMKLDEKQIAERLDVIKSGTVVETPIKSPIIETKKIIKL